MVHMTVLGHLFSGSGIPISSGYQVLGTLASS